VGDSSDDFGLTNNFRNFWLKRYF